MPLERQESAHVLQAQFQDVLSRLLRMPCPKVFVAVSGGSDSMALLDLTRYWGRKHGVAVEVLTVDHGLRDGSEAEAEYVAQCCDHWGLTHHSHLWQDWNERGNLQQAARWARYKFFAQIAKEAPVLLAHTLDDQAETFVMRLARGSGVRGLCAMGEDITLPTAQGIVRILRPLLEMRREVLREYLGVQELTWFDDPSNKSYRFERVRIRESMPDLAKLSLKAERLSSTASTMVRARSALNARLLQCARQTVVSLAPDAQLDIMGLKLWDMETQLYLLSRIIAFCGGQQITEASLLRLHRALFEGRSFALGHVLFWQNKTRPNGLAYVTREAAQLKNEITQIEGKFVWDQRWIVSHLQSHETIAPVDPRHLRADLPNIPFPARQVLPGLFVGGEMKTYAQNIANGNSLSDRVFKPFRQSFTQFVVKD